MLIDLSKVRSLIRYLAFKILTSIHLVWLPLAVFFLAAAAFRKLFYASHLPLTLTLNHYKLLVVIAPFLPPANGIGDTPPLPYYLSVHSSILVLETTLFTLFVLGLDIVLSQLLLWFWVSSIGRCGVSSCRKCLDTSWYRTKLF